MVWSTTKKLFVVDNNYKIKGGLTTEKSANGKQIVLLINTKQRMLCAGPNSPICFLRWPLELPKIFLHVICIILPNETRHAGKVSPVKDISDSLKYVIVIGIPLVA